MDIQKDFFFISYSWKNPEVLEDAKYFKDHYVNYWLDQNGVRMTDDAWYKRVECTVNDPNCKGAMFYLSVDSLASGQVEKEMHIIEKKRASCPDFFLIAALIGGYSVPHLIKQLYMSMDDTQLAKVLPITRIGTVSRLFPDDKIFIVRDPAELEKYHQRLLKELSACGVVLDRESIEDELRNEKKLDAYKRYSFGKFYETETVDNTFLAKENVFQERNGTWLIKLEDGTVHKAAPIKWIILDYNNERIRLMSERVLEKIRGRDIDMWLNTVFLPLAFNEEERSKLVGDLRILTYEEYVKYSEVSEINPTDENFWLNSINKRSEPNMLMCVNGNKINELGMQKERKNGIRPVIEICAENM